MIQSATMVHSSRSGAFSLAEVDTETEELGDVLAEEEIGTEGISADVEEPE